MRSPRSMPAIHFSGLTRVAVFGDERAGGGFDIGYDSGRRSEFRIGYEIVRRQTEPADRRRRPANREGQHRRIPRPLRLGRSGQPFCATAREPVLSSPLSRVLQSPDLPRPIDQLEVQTSNLIPLGPKTSLFAEFLEEPPFAGSAGPFQVFSLGGPFRLGAYLPDEFIGNHYAYASFGFRRELYRLPQLVGRKIYWGGWYEAGTAFGTAASDPGPIVIRGTFNLG